MTLAAIVSHAQRRLADNGIATEDAALDAELLARDVLGWDRAAFVARRLETPPPWFAARFDALVDRRAAREPMAYIRGRQEFYGREFLVSPAVLIPRPETELLVEEALPLLAARSAGERPSVVDVGTGSGCLAVTLALECPRARHVATDVSTAALGVARDNARRHRVTERIGFVCASGLAGLSEAWHLIVTNPPYVAEVERGALPPEVRLWEPATALFAGADGLRDIHEILRQADVALADEGVLLMEIGYGQHDRVAALVRDTNDLALVRFRHDLQHIPRVAVVQRRR